MSFKRKLQFYKFRFLRPMKNGRFWRHFAFLFCVAVLLRLLLALPALAEPATLLRPDSMGYWSPATALAAGDGYVTAPGSNIPELIRPCGYPWFLALTIKLFGSSFLPAALAGILLGASGVLPITLALRKFTGDRPALLGGWLYALNMTAIAVSPLILADNLLGIIAAWQLFMTIYLIKERQMVYFAGLTLLAIAGCFVKPVNLPVVLVGLPVILLATAHGWKSLVAGMVTLIFFVSLLLVPIWYENYKLCGGFDGNTANIYFHNGSAISAHATGESSEVWKKRLLAQADAAFRKNPAKYQSLKAQNEWKKAQFIKLIKQYPVSAAITHLPNVFNLLPDLPTMLENNHITRGERGTMAVLRQQGFIAAVQHYLGDKWGWIFILLPLLAVHLLTLLLAAVRLTFYLFKRQWRYLLIFGVLAFYYIWAPGPVISPRYLLPALPMLIAMATQMTLKMDFTTEDNNIERITL